MPIAEDGSVVNDSFYATPPLGREAAAAARRFSDANSERVAEAAESPAVWADVVSVAPLQVRRRGGVVTPAGRGASYTPAVGHRVLCIYDDHNQLVVLDHIIGP